ncbi:MAG TPA: Rieske 2Fe-2S domain-containing protein, partial [Acidobacteriaceae bacterium]|nr:Rieske 2Fe-2S domain-containing protein [Acidobacteriaceae bacterium]
MPMTPQVPATTLIYNDWYPAMRSNRLRGTKLDTTMLMGIPMVLGRRADGKLFAMRDSCPHRGIPLSCGWFDGQELTCKYHGWAFEPASGQCARIPSLTQRDTLD